MPPGELNIYGMRTLKTFEQFDNTGLLSADWRPILPQTIVVLKGDDDGRPMERTFRLGNIIKNANMTQVIYEATKSIFGHPDEMSVDVYYYEGAEHKMAVDIMYGDLVASEFTVTSPNKVRVVEDTGYGSKFDPSNTVFALSDETINALVRFINEVDGFTVSADQLHFLRPGRRYER
jgi:hypothetical protein